MENEVMKTCSAHRKTNYLFPDAAVPVDITMKPDAALEPVAGVPELACRKKTI
jgi:hypothetical protein